MKKVFLIYLLTIGSSFLFASSFTQEHNASKSYSHPSFVIYNDEPYRTLKSVPADTLITNSEFWSNLKSEANQQVLPTGSETPPTTDTDEIVKSLVSDDNNTPIVPSPLPEFSNSTVSVNYQENGTGIAYTASATDATSYSISGNDSSFFNFTEDGVITFKSSPDFENPTDQDNDNIYSITITATNDVGSEDLILSIEVTDDISDNPVPPVFTSTSSTVSIAENSTGTVYTADATGAESYSISGGDDSALFSINTATGVVTFITSPDYENPADQGTDNAYSLTITATNTVGSAELSLTVAVTDDTSDNSVTDDPDLPNAGSTDVVLGGISTTGYISGNGGRLSAGFAISGGNMTVLTTGKGAKEYLSTGSLQDTLNDPKMEIKALSGSSWSSQHNDLNWKTGNYFSQLDATGFFALYEDDDTGIYETLSANNYLAEITSTDGDSGGTLVEVYETYGYWNFTYTGSKLEGISTNGYVRAGNEPGQRMTAGVALRNFGTDGSATKRVIVMAKWSTYVPSNDNDATNNFDILDDPRIEVTDANKNILAQNDNWGTLPASVKSAIEKTGLMSGFREDKDAAVIVNLPGNGVYFMNVYSTDGDSGGALVEVYDLDALEEKYSWNLGN